jgi:hypothetical protein
LAEAGGENERSEALRRTQRLNGDKAARPVIEWRETGGPPTITGRRVMRVAVPLCPYNGRNRDEPLIAVALVVVVVEELERAFQQLHQGDVGRRADVQAGLANQDALSTGTSPK